MQLGWIVEKNFLPSLLPFVSVVKEGSPTDMRPFHLIRHVGEGFRLTQTGGVVEAERGKDELCPLARNCCLETSPWIIGGSTNSCCSFPWILATDTNGAYLSHFTRWYWWCLMVTSRCSVTGGRVSGLIQLCPRWNNLGLVWGESGPELMLSGVDDTTNQTSVTIFLAIRSCL